MEALLHELNARRARDRKPFSALCYAPFSQLHFEPNGAITTCSKSLDRVLGWVGRDRILEVWRGRARAVVTEALRDDRFPTGCGTCAAALQGELVGNNPLLDFDALPLPTLPEWPARLEFAFSDLCNLACVHCSPRLSSVLRVRAGLSKPPQVYDDAFFTEIEPLLQHVQEVSLLGGEPLLQPEVHRLVDLMVASGRRIAVHVTTNGTVYDSRVERLLGVLPTNVSVSLDGMTPRTFERTRVGAKLDRVLENLERFAARLRGTGGSLRLNFCIMRSTWRELPQFLRFAAAQGASTWLSLVSAPAAVSLLQLAPRSLAYVHDALAARSDELRGLPAEDLAKWASILRALRTAAAVVDDRPPTLSDPERLRQLQSALLRGDERAVRRVAAAIGAIPNLDLVHQLRAKGQHALAMELARKVPRSAPEGAMALILRAEHHLAHGELGFAEVLLGEASRLPSPPLDLHLRLAWLCVRNERWDACEQHLQRLAAGLAAAGPGMPEHLQLGLREVRAAMPG